MSLKISFYLKTSGRNPVKEFIDKCSKELQLDFYDALKVLQDGDTLSMPRSRNLSSIYAGLHELRLKDRYGQVRVFYFVKKKHAIYLIHAFNKKSQELSKKEIELVLKRIQEILYALGNS